MNTCLMDVQSHIWAPTADLLLKKYYMLFLILISCMLISNGLVAIVIITGIVTTGHKGWLYCWLLKSSSVMFVSISIFHCVNDCQLFCMISSVIINCGGASITMLIYFAYICIYNNITSEASVDLQKVATFQKHYQTGCYITNSTLSMIV